MDLYGSSAYGAGYGSSLYGGGMSGYGSYGGYGGYGGYGYGGSLYNSYGGMYGSPYGMGMGSPFLDASIREMNNTVHSVNWVSSLLRGSVEALNASFMSIIRLVQQGGQLRSEVSQNVQTSTASRSLYLAFHSIRQQFRRMVGLQPLPEPDPKRFMPPQQTQAVHVLGPDGKISVVQQPVPQPPPNHISWLPVILAGAAAWFLLSMVFRAFRGKPRTRRPLLTAPPGALGTAGATSGPGLGYGASGALGGYGASTHGYGSSALDSSYSAAAAGYGSAYGGAYGSAYGGVYSSPFASSALSPSYGSAYGSGVLR